MINYNSIIEEYYAGSPKLKEILAVHSRMVAEKALECARRRNLDVDLDFAEEAAMLHDIGIIRCNAPDIECHGELPYICHGIAGGQMLRNHNLPRHTLVCERHTGAGLSKEDIIRQNLPLPHEDFLPVTVEEKLICYADKFYSKSGDLTKEKPLDKVIRSMERHGGDSLSRFLEMHAMFG